LDVPLFLLAQLVGAIAATLLFRWLVPSLRQQAENVVLPHAGESGDS
jgi:glycerol uptake facilitator-like aquaporin